MILELNTENDTKKFAQEFARKIKKGDNIFLIGDLGVGKTFLTRELVKNLGFSDTVNSPSFKLINEYVNCKNDKDLRILHFDLYRLDSLDEIEYLGWEEYLKSSDICIVEWAEKAKELWSKNRYELYLDYDKNDFRKRVLEIL